MEVVFLIMCILVWDFKTIDGLTDPNDVSALKAMYGGLNSPSQLAQWTGDDPCTQSWTGITCSGSRVTEIKISGLGLTGSLGYQLSSLTSVTNLDVSNNNLSGDMTYQLPPNLQRLNLENNKFTGGLPYSISQMPSLSYLNVGHNQLQNELGDMFAQLSSLSTLDLSFNFMIGNLPESFSSLSSMKTMLLQNNRFTGTIDVLANLPLENLNVANNQFTGWIPQQFKDINVQTGGNAWSSGTAPPLPPGISPASEDRNNNTSRTDRPTDSGVGSHQRKSSGIGVGGIVGIVISLIVVVAIVALILAKRIKRKTSSDIEKLDIQTFAPLASNEMREQKSVETSSEVKIATFDPPASLNFGPPPVDRHKSFDGDDFSKKIASFDPPASLNIRPPPVDRHKSFDGDDIPMKPVIVKKLVTSPNVRSYSVADLQMATGSFNVDNLVGEGSFGRVYRAQFDNGKVLAVKKISSSIIESSEDFTEIVLKISNLHHPNITELAGYCSEHGQNLLVYEFYKNGSLHDYLHLSEEDAKPLTWNTRVKIALGTARALEYLHEVCSPSIIHKNIKSANILLDGELNPHLSDSCLATSIPSPNLEVDYGYNAPEVAMSGQYTLKSDVYSFGVVMLELLSGRQPLDSSRPRSEQSLVRWAIPQLHDIDALTKMVDPALNGLYPVKSLSRFADIIALCVQPEPEFRLPMSEVVQALVRLVQRANMSKRTFGIENNPDTQD